MGTAKRERQKANRQQRLQELAKEARKEKTKGLALKIGGAVVAFVAVVGAIYAFSGNKSESTPASTLSPVSTFLPPSTVSVPTPPKPTVKFPGTAPTELKVTDLKEGTGEAAKVGDTITLHYVGVLSTDGTEFDNSYDRGQPFTFTLGNGEVITGWDQGLVGVKAGGQRQLDIPADLAYGDQDRGDVIKAGSALTFVVDVVSVTPAPGSTTVPATATATT
ncbi:MAG: hypothetical protein RLZ14_732 [Actinomycetota bacterium]